MDLVTIHPVRALADNYAYLVVDEATRRAAVVDPSEAPPVEEALARLGLRLAAIWNTHHHWDHVGGNEALIARHGPLEVLASEPDAVPGKTRGLADGERFAHGAAEVEALRVPGHTLGHVAYRVGRDVFTGDTLFGAGCGRLFEGTPAQMVASLGRLRALPDDTRLWCGHEYTRHNLEFGVTIDPANAALAERLRRVREAEGRPTIPLSLPEERATNPFLRWDAPTLATWAGASDPVAVFAAVRAHKDGWRQG
jgi:hydroxyacylglutathione hydrolase